MWYIIPMLANLVLVITAAVYIGKIPHIQDATWVTQLNNCQTATVACTAYPAFAHMSSDNKMCSMKNLQLVGSSSNNMVAAIILLIASTLLLLRDVFDIYHVKTKFAMFTGEGSDRLAERLGRGFRHSAAGYHMAVLVTGGILLAINTSWTLTYHNSVVTPELRALAPARAANMSLNGLCQNNTQMGKTVASFAFLRTFFSLVWGPWFEIIKLSAGASIAEWFHNLPRLFIGITGSALMNVLMIGFGVTIGAYGFSTLTNDNFFNLSDLVVPTADPDNRIQLYMHMQWDFKQTGLGLFYVFRILVSSLGFFLAAWVLGSWVLGGLTRQQKDGSYAHPFASIWTNSSAWPKSIFYIVQTAMVAVGCAIVILASYELLPFVVPAIPEDAALAWITVQTYAIADANGAATANTAATEAEKYQPRFDKTPPVVLFILVLVWVYTALGLAFTPTINTESGYVGDNELQNDKSFVAGQMPEQVPLIAPTQNAAKRPVMTTGRNALSQGDDW
jgi:hypothetical protein